MKTPFAAPYKFEMLHRVGHINLTARNLSIRQCLVEQASRRPGKGTALPIFLVSGLLSDKDDAGCSRPLAENGLSGVFVKVTAFTGTSSLAQALSVRRGGKKSAADFCSLIATISGYHFLDVGSRAFQQITEEVLVKALRRT